MKEDQCATADGEDFTHFDIAPTHGKVSEQRASGLHRGGINDVSVRHACGRPRQADLRHPGMGQGRHKLIKEFVEPPVEGRNVPPAVPQTLEGSQDVCLTGAARRACRDDHGPDQHPNVEPPLARDYTVLLAQTLDIPFRQSRFEYVARIFSCHLRPVR